MLTSSRSVSRIPEVLLAALFAGCAVRAPAPAPETPRAPAPRALPAEEVRAPFLVFARVSDRMEELRLEWGFPGASVGFVLPDDSVGEVVVGFADSDRKRALQPDDRLLAGSIGKTFVAAVALELAEEGTLDLDRRLAHWLGDEPWYDRLPNGSEVTLRQLLQHRSGIPEHVLLPEFWRDSAAEPDRVWKPEELVAYVLDREPLSAPGMAFHYADTNYILVGMALERATGESWYALARERVIEPLGLERTIPAVGRSIDGLVPGHLAPDNALGWPEVTIVDGRLVVDPQLEWTGGGFASTGPDLARWARALYGGSFLSEANLRAMLDAKPTGSSRSPGAYGLGVQVQESRYGPVEGHAGWFPGYLSEMCWFPELRIAVAVQLNSDVHPPETTMRTLVLEIVDAILEE